VVLSIVVFVDPPLELLVDLSPTVELVLLSMELVPVFVALGETVEVPLVAVVPAVVGSELFLVALVVAVVLSAYNTDLFSWRVKASTATESATHMVANIIFVFMKRDF
jgi:hypothetical protein